MRHAPAQYAEALFEALEGASPEARKERIARFLRLLERERAKHLLRKVLIRYEKIFLRRKGLRKVDVESARPLSDAVRKDIEDALESPVLLTETVNPELLAGVRITLDDSVLIDASAKSKIANLFT